MIQIITTLYDRIISLSISSPILAGLISLWGLTVITYLLKTIPSKIFKILKVQLTSSLEFDNAQGYYHKEIYYACMNWFYTSKSFLKLSRVLSLYTTDKYDDATNQNTTEVALGPGYGTHVFVFEKKLMWMKLEKIDSSGSELQKRSVTIGCLGRNKEIFNHFVDAFKPVENSKSIYTSVFSSGSWRKESISMKRPLESLAMDNAIKNKLISEIKYFDSQEEWFVEKGLPYKLTFILHGIPGTGKTSTIKTLASYFGKNLCVLNINSVSDESFQAALTKTPPGSILVIEDFDSNSATTSRGPSRVEIESKPNEDIVEDNEPTVKQIQETFSFLSLSGILNGLDGIRNLHNIIIFLTTNYLNSVDPAIYRKGRVDHIIELKKVPAKNVHEYSEYIFPDYDFSDIVFKDTIGCNLNSALLISQSDPIKYLEELLG